MCRLYGFFATRAVTIECGLIRAQNALIVQSAGDSRGVSHQDGWGIALYRDPPKWIQERHASAAEPGKFEEAIRGHRASVVVSHVRRASVGPISLVNTHPFLSGMTCLAHNGTIPAFEQIEPDLLRDLPPRLRSRRKGQTDSELFFLWLRSQVPGPRAFRGSGFERCVRDVGRAVRHLLDKCRSTTSMPVRLNFVLTNGRYLLALRCDESLYWVERDQHHRCEICQECRCQACAGPSEEEPRRSYRSIAVASEPLTREMWRSVPNHHVLAVDEAARAEIYPI